MPLYPAESEKIDHGFVLGICDHDISGESQVEKTSVIYMAEDCCLADYFIASGLIKAFNGEEEEGMPMLIIFPTGTFTNNDGNTS